MWYYNLYGVVKTLAGVWVIYRDTHTYTHTREMTINASQSIMLSDQVRPQTTGGS